MLFNMKKYKNFIINRILCSHFYWEEASPFLYGSLGRGVIVCKNCEKIKFIEQLKDYEIIL